MRADARIERSAPAAAREWSPGEDMAFLDWLARVDRNLELPDRSGLLVVFTCGRCGEQRTTSLSWGARPHCCGIPMTARLCATSRRDVWP
jgi:hypothetical protein